MNFILCSDGFYWDVATDAGFAPTGEYFVDWLVVECSSPWIARLAAEAFRKGWTYARLVDGVSIASQGLARDLFMVSP